jgi:hypothetical protein
MDEKINLADVMQVEEKKTLESAIFDVLKELSDKKKSDILTELSDNEIKLITRLEMISTMRNNKRYREAAEMVMKLRISKNRKSRAEIIAGIKAAHPEAKFPQQNEHLRQLLS